MTQRNNNYCVILAGGKGRRLWPVSRERFPKQFIDFFNVGRTQLQQTFDRFAKFIPQENIFVNTSEDYLELVKEQLPKLADDHIMQSLFTAIQPRAWHGQPTASCTLILTPT